MCEISSKLAMPLSRYDIFIVNSEQILHIFIKFLWSIFIK